MNEFQKRIKKFSDERDWNKFYNPKDLLLGIVEEVGEIRNLVKWEQDPEKIKKVLEDNREELEDNIGDLYWFLAILANTNDVDLDKAIDTVITKNEKRFPIEDVKSRHTNRYLGGKDKQYSD
ncbi:MAG: nucleotide pyrophosphohydrolase [Candidatus Sungbacteria bacterium]|nr:nucleotide pyrophosphohydrolase [Candidatus Sungbacteria bacterium]